MWTSEKAEKSAPRSARDCDSLSLYGVQDAKRMATAHGIDASAHEPAHQTEVRTHVYVVAASACVLGAHCAWGGKRSHSMRSEMKKKDRTLRSISRRETLKVCLV